MNKRIITGLVLVCTIIAFFKIFPFHSCPYQEEFKDLPAGFKDATLQLIKPATLITGEDQEYKCLTEMGMIPRKVVQPDEAQNYQTQLKDFKQETLPAGTTWKLVKQLRIMKSGASSMDSGKGPFEHLILQDDKGQLYEIPVTSLGVNEGDEIMAQKTDQGEQKLRPEVFLFQK